MTGKHIKRVADSKQIPIETATSKIKRTLIGMGTVVLAIVIAVWLIPPLSHWVVYPLLIYGGYCLAGDIMRNLFEWLPAALKDLAAGVRELVAAIKGSS